MSDVRRKLGSLAEDLVANRLEAAGWTLLGRNVRTRRGEIDLIARHRGDLVFVEVKSSTAGSRVGPERPVFAVGPQKQGRLRRLAREWLAENRPPPGCVAVRFDVVGVTFNRSGQPIAVEHIANAF
jgi:putative endonuclease